MAHVIHGASFSRVIMLTRRRIGPVPARDSLVTPYTPVLLGEYYRGNTTVQIAVLFYLRR
jgi:hypothetical protein